MSSYKVTSAPLQRIRLYQPHCRLAAYANTAPRQQGKHIHMLRLVVQPHARKPRDSLRPVCAAQLRSDSCQSALAPAYWLTGAKLQGPACSTTQLTAATCLHQLLLILITAISVLVVPELLCRVVTVLVSDLNVGHISIHEQMQRLHATTSASSSQGSTISLLRL
jgi:hypothetical protein